MTPADRQLLLDEIAEAERFADRMSYARPPVDAEHAFMRSLQVEANLRGLERLRGLLAELDEVAA